jgi:hypothetical protein
MNSVKYLIVGGGMVAGYAAKELASKQLRSGELTIISADKAFPYERPPLSKGFWRERNQPTGFSSTVPIGTAIKESKSDCRPVSMMLI